MTLLKANRFALLLVTIAAINHSNGFSQKPAPDQEQGDVKSMITAKKFLFEAESATPSGGRLINLSYGYFIRLSGDTLESNLPYYGRSNSPSFDPSATGFRFTSTSFDYSVSDRKKGGWDVSIKFKDQSEARVYSFSVFQNGNASLRVTSTSRQSISYQGHVSNGQKQKEK